MIFNSSSSGPICCCTLSVSAVESSSPLPRLSLCSAPGRRRMALRSGWPVRRVLLARRIECRQIAGDQFAIVAGRLLRRAIDGERQLHVAADQVLLERAAQFHLQRVEARRQAQLHIEKAVIHALEAERVTELIVLTRAPECGQIRSWNICGMLYSSVSPESAAAAQ